MNRAWLTKSPGMVLLGRMQIFRPTTECRSSEPKVGEGIDYISHKKHTLPESRSPTHNKFATDSWNNWQNQSKRTGFKVAKPFMPTLFTSKCSLWSPLTSPWVRLCTMLPCNNPVRCLRTSVSQTAILSLKHFFGHPSHWEASSPTRVAVFAAHIAFRSKSK